MAENPEFGRRLRDAKRDWERANDRDLTWAEIGRRVGVLLARDPFPHQVVLRWFKQGREPSFDITEALAVTLGTSPGRLAFGEEGASGSAARMAELERAGVPKVPPSRIPSARSGPAPARRGAKPAKKRRAGGS